MNISAATVETVAHSLIQVSGLGPVKGEGAGNIGAGGTFGGSGGRAVCGSSAAPYYVANEVVGTVDTCTSVLMGSGGGSEGAGRGGGGVSISGATVSLSGVITADGSSSTTANLGSGSGGGVCVQAQNLFVSGTINARGARSIGNSGAGGGGRVTLKYCDLDTTVSAKILYHGGDGDNVCMNGGAGTWYSHQQCDEAVLADMVFIDNNAQPTRAMTPIGDHLAMPAGVTLSALTALKSAVVGTRRLTVKVRWFAVVQPAQSFARSFVTVCRWGV